jgi:predicted TIM-barrel fold metal-dependent hydrolase
MPGQGLIDIHQHLLTDAYLAAMQAAGVADVDGFPTPQWSAPTALQLMDACGIATGMLSISAPGIDFVRGEAARKLARSINEEQARLVTQHPGRFGSLAILPLPDVDAALGELTYALDTLKADGIVLFTNVGGIYLGDKRFDPMFDELNRRRAVVFVHPVAPPGFDMARLSLPAPTVEFPFDTTRMILNMIASGTVRRCPDVRMIVAHGGGTLPFLANRVARHVVRFAKVSPPLTPEEVQAALRWFWFDVTAVSHLNAFDALLALAPREKLLYGSDHPFMLANLIPPAIEFVNIYPQLDEGSRQALRRGNAEKLFPRLAA